MILKREPNHPGRILFKDYIEPLNLSISGLAKCLKVSRKAISAIVNERKSITPDMSLRLSNAFDTTPELWLNLQKNYDLWHAARQSDDWKNIEKIDCEAQLAAC